MKAKVFFIIVFFGMVSIATVRAQVTIGSGTEPASGALLDLKEFANQDTTSAIRGLLFPRVKLTTMTELYPMYGKNAASETLEYKNNRSALKIKHTGLVVYNLSKDTIFSQGLYVWNGSIWIKPVTEVPTLPSSPSVNMLDLQTSVSPVAPGDSKNNGTTGGGGSKLNFGTITIPESGSYIFSFRLYGKHKVATGVYYMSLWANGSELKDIAEIDVKVGAFQSGTPACTYSITMGGHFNPKDVVSFKLASHPILSKGNDWSLESNPGKNANRTSLIWWRL